MNILSVSQFIEFLNSALSAAVFPEGAVIEGEVAEYRVSQDKWIWFLLKDSSAVVSCFATVWQLRTPLEDGMQIRVFGTPKVHPKSGKFSVTVERVELVGEGALRRAFELLKKKLAAEGLFAPERKRRIPRFPERIGLIASRESAAKSDFVRILGDRWGGIAINLIHVQVQGRDAARDIVGAFRYFNEHSELAEVIVLTRGGGSLEDLQAFNSEDVARAVFASKAPVIVGVGHERDETLADFVADVRASTPSNAAERLVPDRREVAAAIGGGARRMSLAFGAVLAARMAEVASMGDKLETWVGRRLADFAHLIKDFERYFTAYAGRTAAVGVAIGSFIDRLTAAAGRQANRQQDDLAAKERLLRVLDPMRLLERGYSLLRIDGKIVKDAAKVDIGAAAEVQLHRGILSAKVIGKKYGQEQERRV